MVHIYRVKRDLWYPSVTTVIHEIMEEPPDLTNWKLRNGDWEKKVEESQIIGTLVHYRILSEYAPNILELPRVEFSKFPKDAAYKVELAHAMWDKLEMNVKQPCQVEKLQFNHEYKFAGSPDMVGPIKMSHDDSHILSVADLKTSKEIRKSHKLQIGGYWELTGCEADRGLLISLSPDVYYNKHLRGHVVEIPKSDLERYRGEFLELLEEFHKLDCTSKLRKQYGIA